LRSFIFFAPGYLAAIFLFQNRSALNKHQQEVIALPIMLISIAALSRAFLSDNIEGFQFDILLQTPAAAFLLLGCLTILRQNAGHTAPTEFQRKILILLISAQLAYGVLSTVVSSLPKRPAVEKTFVLQVKEALKDRSKIGAFIVNQETMNSFTADPRMCLFCNFLKHIGNGYWANQINLPASLDEVKFKERTNATELSPFFRFLEMLKRENNYLNYEDAQMRFIQANAVDFIVIENGAAIPKGILNGTLSMISDPLSGTTVLLLRRTCLPINKN